MNSDEFAKAVCDTLIEGGYTFTYKYDGPGSHAIQLHQGVEGTIRIKPDGTYSLRGRNNVRYSDKINSDSLVAISALILD